jgi:hypothetical protein
MGANPRDGIQDIPHHRVDVELGNQAAADLHTAPDDEGGPVTQNTQRASTFVARSYLSAIFTMTSSI